MKKKGIKIAAYALIGTMAVSSYQLSLEAKINSMNNTIPAAGVAVVLENGHTIAQLQEEVVQNIAYLENASGIRPNIIIAAEKVALADVPLNITAAGNISGRNVVVNDRLIEGISVADESEAAEPESRIEKAAIKETLIIEDISIEDISIEDISAEDKTLTEEEAIDKSSEESQTDETAALADVPKQASSEGSEESSAQTSEDESDDSGEDKEESSTDTSESEDEKTDDTKADTGNAVIGAGFDATEIYSADQTESGDDGKSEEKMSEEQDFSGLVIARVNNYVNVRSIPGEDGEIVGKLYDKSVGEFIEEKDGWYKIKSGNCTGYVKGEYCVVGDEAEAIAKEVGTTYAIVNTTTLKVRQEASLESSVLGLVPIDEELVVVEELDGWVKIAIEEGDGYVSREYVNLRTDFVHAESKEEEQARLEKEAKAREEALAAARQAAAERQAEAAKKAAENQTSSDNESVSAQPSAEPVQSAPQQGSEIGKSVIDYATQFVGNPYVYGGTSLTNGADCSGFVMSVYKNFGVSLPHSSSALRSQGYDVGGLENAQAGDIVCYSGHVGLYVGNGQIVHASTSKTGIIISNASYRKVLSVRRIF